MTRLHPFRLAALSIGLAMVALACTNAGATPAPAGDALRIVASPTVFADIVKQIGGDHVDVSSIVPAGAGPEDYEPKPDDARGLAGAQLIVSNGVGLDDFLDRLLASGSGGTTPRLVLGEGIPPITIDGEPNPHFWLDPTIVKTAYLPKIVTALSAIAPADAAMFQANAAAYGTRSWISHSSASLKPSPSLPSRFSTGTS